jgi:hypothetical protein
LGRSSPSLAFPSEVAHRAPFSLWEGAKGREEVSTKMKDYLNKKNTYEEL